MAFGLEFFTVAPGLRLAGDSIAYAYKFTKRGGEADGTDGLEIGLTDDPTVKLLEASVSGFEQVADRDAVYVALAAGGLKEIVPGLLVGVDSLSSIDTTTNTIRLGVAGAQPVLQFRKANVQAVIKVGDGGYTWDLPTATFDALKIAAESYQSELKTQVNEMIAARIAADDLLDDAIVAEAVARALEDSNLDGRLDVLEADPTTAAAVAAGDAATLSSANSYTDTSITNIIGTAPGVLDTLGEIADAINDDANVYTTLVAQIDAVQSDVDGNETDSDAAEAALSGRLDTLEADPVTKTYVDAADTTLQGNIDTEAGARASADSALDGRLDTLEADPVTKTYVDTADALKLDAADVSSYGLTLIDDADAATARTTLGLGTAATTDASAYATAAQGALADTAVQPAAISNVDNTSDADKPVSTAQQAALDLKAPIADPDFTGQLEVDVNLRLEFDSNLTKIHNILRGTSIEIGNNIQMKPAAAGGRVEIAGALQIDITEVPEAANDTQAAAAGIIVGGLYRSNSVLHIRVS